MKNLNLNLFILIFILIGITACIKAEQNIVKKCTAWYYFDRVDTKGKHVKSFRQYSYYCKDLNEFKKDTSIMLKKDEPTSTEIKSRVFAE